MDTELWILLGILVVTLIFGATCMAIENREAEERIRNGAHSDGGNDGDWWE